MKIRMWFKSAIDGLFVSRKHVQENPETTYKQAHKEDEASPETTVMEKLLEADRKINEGLRMTTRELFESWCPSAWESDLQAKPWDGKIEYPLGKPVEGTLR